MNNREIETQHGKVNITVYGEDSKPAIVCLHGLAGNGFYSFDQLAAQLKNRFHLLILDLPGHGKTDAFQHEEQYLFSNMAGWLFETLNQIIQKPFYVMGHSWGADTALHFTRHFPANVQGLILLDGGFIFPQNQPEMTFDFAYSGWNDYMDTSVFQSVDDIYEEYRSYTEHWDSQKEQFARSIFQKKYDGKYELIASKFTVLSIIKAFFKEPFAGAYPFIKVPTLLIHAEHPKELDEARDKGVRQLKDAIEDITVLTIPGSSHMIQWDYPEQLAAVIEKWIGEKPQQVKFLK